MQQWGSVVGGRWSPLWKPLLQSCSVIGVYYFPKLSTVILISSFSHSRHPSRRDLFAAYAVKTRGVFESKKNIKDQGAINTAVKEAEDWLASNTHPDPYRSTSYYKNIYIFFLFLTPCPPFFCFAASCDPYIDFLLHFHPFQSPLQSPRIWAVPSSREMLPRDLSPGVYVFFICGF